MNEITFTDPCILFALHREAGPFLQSNRPHLRFPGAPCWAGFCGPAPHTVVVTGVGPTKLEAALGWAFSNPLLGNYRPRLVLSAGFSGALVENLQIGDIILATEVMDEAGNCWPASTDRRPGGAQLGRILATPKLIGDPHEKQSLGQTHQALAIDMESASVARLCAKHQIPFACVRAISDRADQALSPHLTSLLGGSRVSPFKLLAGLVRHPSLVMELRRLARDTNLAARSLATALTALLAS